MPVVEESLLIVAPQEPLFDPIVGWVFGRDIRERLRGLKRGVERSGLLSLLDAS